MAWAAKGRLALALFLSVVASFPNSGALAECVEDPHHPGQWAVASGIWPWIPIHMVLLPGGSSGHHSRILYFSGDDVSTGSFRGGMRGWDPSSAGCDSFPSDTNITVPSPGVDIFCSGHSRLGDGRVMIAGGSMLLNLGNPNALIFDPDSLADPWTHLPDLADRRWYPTNTTLGNGRVFVHSGEKNGHLILFGGRPAAAAAPVDSALHRLGLTYGAFPAGYHAVEWDGTNARGTRLGSGIFIYRITAGTFRQQRKLALVP
jgi:hypothetical protein